MAGDYCQPTDLCASSATESVPCPTQTGDASSDCPFLPTGASCTALAGACSDDQQCNANNQYFKNYDTSPTPSATGLLGTLDSTLGVCITPVAAGLPCKPGTDMCSGASTFAGMWCTISPCPSARPGAECRFGSDFCSNGGVGTSACPDSDQENHECEPVAPDGTCLAGDECTTGQVCNGVGTTPGKCVTPIAAGAACPNSAADTCIVTIANYETLNDVQLGTACSAATCPLATAGYACGDGDMCSDGSSEGSLCPTGSPRICAPLPPDTPKCFANDKCLPKDDVPQYCNAKGTAPGVCKPITAAGAACTATGDNPDVCSPYGALCSAATCPLVVAGENCVANDRCNSGACVTENIQGGNAPVCPPMATGLPCTATDICVRGAQCIGAQAQQGKTGKCEPNGKVDMSTATPVATPDAPAVATPTATPAATPVATPTPTPSKAAAAVLSTATRVPVVQSVGRLGDYATIDLFNATEKARFIRVMEATILAKLRAVSNVSITRVSPGSITVANSVAFTEADNDMATAHQNAFATLLGSADGAASVYGTTFGAVTVSNVTKATAPNPVYSGCTMTGMTWTLGVALATLALGMAVHV